MPGYPLFLYGHAAPAVAPLRPANATQRRHPSAPLQQPPGPQTPEASGDQGQLSCYGKFMRCIGFNECLCCRSSNKSSQKANTDDSRTRPSAASAAEQPVARQGLGEARPWQHGHLVAFSGEWEGCLYRTPDGLNCGDRPGSSSAPWALCLADASRPDQARFPTWQRDPPLPMVDTLTCKGLTMAEELLRRPHVNKALCLGDSPYDHGAMDLALQHPGLATRGLDVTKIKMIYNASHFKLIAEQLSVVREELHEWLKSSDMHSTNFELKQHIWGGFVYGHRLAGGPLPDWRDGWQPKGLQMDIRIRALIKETVFTAGRRKWYFRIVACILYLSAYFPRVSAFTTRAIISHRTTRRTASPSPALYSPFSAAADAYAVCSLGAAVLMGPHMDHPSGSGSNGDICGEERAFFAESNDTTPLYDSHFVIKVQRETEAMSGAAALQAISPDGPAERHEWLPEIIALLSTSS
ncbi:unnamed protein product [Vitrella brassicaformis CCMP3155]|uniref:Uncharacterized protein n=1 Tax=Vitrella brassicaformis (strain CCMP3155) TaxID=1169540 RepID=A0A0G4FNX0_VITBC|nr:unnamed protein product [Vitrella brassicaformis CCMP3155]|eukprot:CEM15924.1 unnamed protein product [Vitrella brassicaformis CCMP3155]